METLVMYSDIKSLKDIIAQDDEFKSIRIMMKESEIIDKFFEIFPHLSKMVEPLKMEKSTLHIYIENASLRNEVKFHETEIVKKINEYFKEKRVRHIKLFGV
jgi:antitoxin component YwqK of YwqJK toxin-antitoxin module